MFARRSDTPFIFPPSVRAAPPAPVLKVGDRVRVRNLEQCGVGLVVGIDADERLVSVSFSGTLGWWSRCDLRKADIHE